MTDDTSSSYFDDGISSISSQFWSRPMSPPPPPPPQSGGGNKEAADAQNPDAQENEAPKPLPQELLLPTFAVFRVETSAEIVASNNTSSTTQRRGLPPLLCLHKDRQGTQRQSLPKFLKIVFTCCLLIFICAVIFIAISVRQSDSTDNDGVSDESSSSSSARAFWEELELPQGQNPTPSVATPTSYPTMHNTNTEKDVFGVASPMDTTLVPTVAPLETKQDDTSTMDEATQVPSPFPTTKPPTTHPTGAPLTYPPTVLPTTRSPTRSPTRRPTYPPSPIPTRTTTKPTHNEKPSSKEEKSDKGKKDKKNLGWFQT